MQKDLHLLATVPHLHLRAKLLTYCTNIRFAYFMGTDRLSMVMPYADMVDHLIHDATCDLLGWPRGADSHNTVVQLRLPIAQGGWSLHSKCVHLIMVTGIPYRLYHRNIGNLRILPCSKVSRLKTSLFMADGAKRKTNGDGMQENHGFPSPEIPPFSICWLSYISYRF